MILGAIEAGGTKFVCGIGNEHGEITERITIPTTTPEETLSNVIDFFKEKPIAALGVGSFGPVDLNPDSATYGFITSTPKKNWNYYNLVGELRKHINVPIGFDTDVNAAALGEMEWGAAKGLDSCLYMTVGTGIGVGAITEGKLIHGMLHPEMGHILVRRHEDDLFNGSCPFHGDCLEGMAAGPAIEARWGQKGTELATNQKVWELEAYYLAQALVNYILVLSPKRLILGGGVMKQAHLFPLIRENVVNLLNGYIQHENILENIDDYIVPPDLGDQAGLCGAIALARKYINI
ncbi:ROK family protein [Bacillus sp. NEB1478]|uniref:ROK family protein n=1 Tax=Bacillus sp. NEB1478 TaxID=3073816 RepID=UPI002873E15A|nr:ROK family protein [Bacillus sp. NEB1478]WNB92634.1 ROK family protein [Bacillus sp. NEB1478]